MLEWEIEDRSDDPHPERTAAASPGNAAGRGPHTEVAEKLERVSKRVGNPLERCARERAPVVAERKPDVRSPRRRIRVRRALARQVGGELEAFRPRRPALRLDVERSVVDDKHMLQPRERTGRAEHHAHRMPRARHRVAEDVDARTVVGGVSREDGEHDTRGPEHDGNETGLDNAYPERGRRLVAGPSHLSGFEHRRQPFNRDLERHAELFRPAPSCDIEQQRSRGVCGVSRSLTRQSKADIVLRQEDVTDPGICIRLELPQPEQLRRGKPCQGTVTGDRDQPLEADPGLDLGALGLRSLIVPENRGSQDSSFGIEDDEPVHLAGESDLALGQACQAGLGRLPPVLGILLRPSRKGRPQRVRLTGSREDLPVVRRDRDPLDASRPDVEPDQHYSPSAA